MGCWFSFGVIVAHALHACSVHTRVNAFRICANVTRDGGPSSANAGIFASAGFNPRANPAVTGVLYILIVDQTLHGFTNESIRTVILATGNLRLHQLFDFRRESDVHIQP
jgi:hypothetical protein